MPLATEVWETVLQPVSKTFQRRKRGACEVPAIRGKLMSPEQTIPTRMNNR